MGKTLAEGAVHHLDPRYRSGIRCGNQGECNATMDLASVTCRSCLDLQAHGYIGAPPAPPAPEECPHTVTRWRGGEERGSWCEACGVQVTAVHDRPCGECRHIRQVIGGHTCHRHLMAVVPSMNVTYYLEPWADGIARGGLCFEAADAQDT